MRNRVVWAALVLASTAAVSAQAQDVTEHDGEATGEATSDGSGQQPAQAERRQETAREQAPAPQQEALGPTSDAFDRACVDLLHGRTPVGEKAIRSLKDACANLMSGRADERLDAERRRKEQLAAREELRSIAEGRQVEPGRATARVEQGQGVLAAFGQAASELTSRTTRTGGMGMRRSGPVGYTLITNPIGWFSGLGVNAELFRAFESAPKLSFVGGARYSTTDASNGTASTFGAMAGVDWFIVGRNNEGFRIGPRVEVAAGREEFEGDTTYARMGLGGELGYNFIASNGVTGLLAGGLGGRVAGDDQNDDFESFVGGELGPYVKVGLGFSW